ncbi:hypothetical protein FMN50_05560 [Rhodobacterales bacterium]|nr:hypothetical protein FMN50_05560 [Rhodobacterales bacterium]
MAIPKTIWQTFRSDKTPPAAQPCMQSWRSVPRGWNYRFSNDEEIEIFIRDHFSREEYNLFRQMPLGVMKADFWRYAVLFRYGGVYADIDTMCRISPDVWCRKNAGLVIGVEDTQDYFCQWVFASEPGHPVLRLALDLIMDRAETDLRIDHPDYVHYRTGPALWTDAVRGFLGLEKSSPEGQLSAQQILDRKEIWSDKDIWIYPLNVFCVNAVAHAYASLRWGKQPQYSSWRADQIRAGARASNPELRPEAAD